MLLISQLFLVIENDPFPFESASIYTPLAHSEDNRNSLSPRAYTLTLSPQLIYSRSRLIPSLVSSKVYRQLEFQAVGSWWLYKDSNEALSSSHDTPLYRVPGSREDVFADENMTSKSKRTLMKFLRYLAQPSAQDEEDQSSEADTPFSQLLETKFKIFSDLCDPLTSLSLSLRSPRDTASSYVIPRIKRHLASIGVFGAGFGSLLTKWGGGSEICQVGCRALAVGGGIYVLNRGVAEVTESNAEHPILRVQLSDGETVESKFVVGSPWDLPRDKQSQGLSFDKVARSITIVSSSLNSLFPPTSEGGPVPAGAIVMFPGSVLPTPNQTDVPPVYLIIHSSDTGECPNGQCKC